MKVTVHPFFRHDGENRTKHRTNLAAALEELTQDLNLRHFQQERRRRFRPEGYLLVNGYQLPAQNF